ncbi:MAG: PIN domain-containing protein [Candidatus Aminicenantes bacterium]|nr:PIN domain-containing protein [Candidatus Aminicenantes bacterium]
MSADRVLVDTSVWIDYFRGTSESVAAKLDALLTEAQVCVPGIVAAELIQGAKSDREIRAVEDILEALTVIGHGPGAWVRAGKISRDLKRRGKTVHLVDCYIAVIAAENGCALFTLDEHFRDIREVLPLRLL